MIFQKCSSVGYVYGNMYGYRTPQGFLAEHAPLERYALSSEFPSEDPSAACGHSTQTMEVHFGTLRSNSGAAFGPQCYTAVSQILTTAKRGVT